MKRTFILLSALGFILLLSACTSTTLIQTEPKDAKVFLNGSYVGQTPYSMSDDKILGTCTEVHIEKDGFAPLTTVICRNERVNIGTAIGGIFFFFPWLWLYDYVPLHTYILEPESKNQNQNPDANYYFSDDDQQVAQPVNSQHTTKAQKLIELKQLLDSGVLTQDEFDKEKKKILDQEEW